MAHSELSRAAALLVCVSLAGCAHEEVRTEPPFARAERAVDDAARAGAEREPLAAFHLRLARQQLARAAQLDQQGDHDRAALLLDRAEADARLAQSRAEESRTRRRDDRARRELEDLRMDQLGPDERDPGEHPEQVR